MGWLDRLFGRSAGNTPVPFDTYDAAQRVLPAPHEPFIGTAGIPVADPGYPLSWAYRGDVERIWRSQPNVRKVVDFIARNVATIPLHVHERVSDTDRQRVTEHPLDDLMSTPRSGVSPFRFWHAVLSDALLYDQWAALLTPTAVGGYELVQIPSWRLKFETDALRRVRSAWFWVGDQSADARQDSENGWRELDLESLIFDHGYAPSSAGMSPMVTLKDILDESAEAVMYRRQTWANGARVPAYMTRPAGSPPWSQAARERFRAEFRAAYVKDGPQAGGVPLLEDGMRLEKFDAFKPQETMDLEGRRLTAVEVAAAFHIAPELVGAQQGNYSNVREFRQMLYRDSLGPYISAIEQTLNAQLTPRRAGARNLYIEANVESKLRGSFEEQAQMLTTAIGAPWMSRAEGRARMNLPEHEGADDLVVPLNVLIGGQASPRDAGSQNVRGAASRSKAVVPARVKAAVPDTYDQRIRKALADFFDRQGRVVKSRIGAGDDDWWDADRWNAELSDDIYRLATLVSSYVGEKTVEEIGFEPSAYNTERTLAFLRAVSDRIAGQVNVTTFGQVTSALEDDDEDDPLAAVDHVFDVAAESRAEQSALTVGTTFAGFAAIEAAKQTVGERATKTWVVNSGNPRASHAAMNGETVGLDENFSNGLPWPGSVEGGADETAGCQCSLEINIP